MLLVPYERFEFQSPLSPVDVARRLEGVTLRHQAWLKSAPSGKRFYGVVSSDAFRLVRVIRGMNTYLPQLHGSVRPADQLGSKISVVVALHPVAVAMILALFGGISFLSLRAGNGISVPLLMLGAFHVAMYFVGFRPEARAARASLQQVLAAA